jgi:hypothetical protein
MRRGSMKFRVLTMSALVASFIGIVLPEIVIPQTSGAPAAGAHMVKGDVLNIEGDQLILKDVSGHEISLHVNQETRMEDRVKVGDKVEAQVTSNGHVASVRVQLPDDVFSRDSFR